MQPNNIDDLRRQSIRTNRNRVRLLLNLPHMYDRSEIEELLRAIESDWERIFPGEDIDTPDAQPPKGIVPQ